MISKKKFCEILEQIKEQEKIDEEFSKALETVCDSWCIYNTKNKIYKVLWDLLKEIFGDKEDWMSWWVYEDVEKVITYNNSKKQTILKTPEQLYDFLINNMKEVGKENAH